MRFGRTASISHRSCVAQTAGRLVLDDGAGPERASRAAMAVMRCVRPCTVMRKPPAAELVASVSSGSSCPVDASSCALAAFTPMVTSPSATEVAATPCPTRRGVASG